MCGICNRKFRHDDWPRSAALESGALVKVCERCARRMELEQWWKDYADDQTEIAIKCKELGVGQRFFRDGKPPSLEDTGLVEHITERPFPKGGLFICGPVGSHKTHLLAARVVDAFRRGWSAHLLKWTDLCLEIRDTFRSGGVPKRFSYHGFASRPMETEGDVIDHYARMDYLAVDDIGIGRESAAESEASLRWGFELFDRRYERGPGVITDVASNLLLEEIETKFDERIGRRIREMTTPYPMLLPEVQA